jgi:hypothetical protein
MFSSECNQHGDETFHRLHLRKAPLHWLAVGTGSKSSRAGDRSADNLLRLGLAKLIHRSPVRTQSVGRDPHRSPWHFGSLRMDVRPRPLPGRCETRLHPLAYDPQRVTGSASRRQQEPITPQPHRLVTDADGALSGKGSEPTSSPPAGSPPVPNGHPKRAQRRAASLLDPSVDHLSLDWQRQAVTWTEDDPRGQERKSNVRFSRRS